MSTPSPSALRLLWLDRGGAALTFMLTALAMAFSIFVVGFALFGFAAGNQLRRHMELAFGESRRGWAAPGAIGTLVVLLALLVAGVWFGLVDQVLGGGSVVVAGAGFRRDGVAFMGLLPVYLLTAWLLTPVLFFAAVCADPRGPVSVRDRMTAALRVTVGVPVLSRLGALLVSAAVLLGPLLAAVFTDDGRFLALLALCWCGHLPLLSALLVSRYALVRDELASDRIRVLRVPGMLLLFGALAGVLSAGALWTATLLQAAALGLAWFATVVAFQGFVRAHRLSLLPTGTEAAPGRRAVAGAVDGTLFRAADGRTFAMPSDRAVGNGRCVLVGEFLPPREGFRQSAHQPWPRGGQTHSGTLDDVLEHDIQQASWRTWLGLAAVTGVAVWLILV